MALPEGLDDGLLAAADLTPQVPTVTDDEWTMYVSNPYGDRNLVVLHKPREGWYVTTIQGAPYETLGEEERDEFIDTALSYARGEPLDSGLEDAIHAALVTAQKDSRMFEDERELAEAFLEEHGDPYDVRRSK